MKRTKKPPQVQVVPDEEEQSGVQVRTNSLIFGTRQPFQKNSNQLYGGDGASLTSKRTHSQMTDREFAEEIRQEPDISINNSNFENKAAKIKRKDCLYIIELIIIVVFMGASIFQIVVEQEVNSYFMLQESLQKTITKIQFQQESIQRPFDSFWKSLFQLMKETQVVRSSDYASLKLGDSELYFISDLRITARKVKLESSDSFGFVRWKSIDFDPLEDSHEQVKDIEETKQFTLYGNTIVDYNVQDSYKGLGGFQFTLSTSNYDIWDDLNGLKFFQDPSKFEINSESTVSLVADTLFFHPATQTFLFAILEAVKYPTGDVVTNFKQIRPVTIKHDDGDNFGKNLWFLFEFLKSVYVFFIFFLETIFFIRLLILYKSEIMKLGQRNKDGQFPKKIVETRRKEIFEEGQIEKTHKFKQIKKFYIENAHSIQSRDLEPSFANGFKAHYFKPQRMLLVFLIAVFIPMTYLTKKNFNLIDQTKLADFSPDQIIRANSSFRKVNKPKLQNSLIQIVENDSKRQFWATIFFVLITLRIVFIIQHQFKSLRKYFKTLKQILVLVLNFMMVFSIVIFTFSSFSFFYFGSRIKRFSTMSDSFLTVILLLLNDHQSLDEMKEIQPTNTFIYFALFIVIVVFFLKEIFSAIIVTTFYRSQKEFNDQEKQKKQEPDFNQKHWMHKVRDFFNLKEDSNTTRTDRSPKETSRCAKLCCAKSKNKNSFGSKGNNHSDPHKSKKRDSKVLNGRKQKQIRKDAPQDSGKRQKSDLGEEMQYTSDSSEDVQKNSQLLENKLNLSICESEQDQTQSDDGIYSDEETRKQPSSLQELTQMDSSDEEDKPRFTSEQIAQLKRGAWMDEFPRWDLEADIMCDSIYASKHEEQAMVKKREQRCGIVIWTTCMQIFYTIMYVTMIYTRFDISNQYSINDDYQDFIENFVIYSDELNCSYDEISSIVLDDNTPKKQCKINRSSDTIMYSQDFYRFKDLYQWINIFVDSMQKKVKKVKDESTSTDEDPLSDIVISYLFSEENYILFQSLQVCVDLYENWHLQIGHIPEAFQFKTDISLDNDIKIRFDPLALGGTGGYCYQVFTSAQELIRDSDKSGKIENQVIIQDGMKKFYERNGLMEKKLEISFLVTEPSNGYYTLIKQSVELEMDSNFSYDLKIKTLDLGNNKSNLFFTVIFFFILLINLYIFVNREYNVYQRYNGWYKLQIETLSKVEQKVRNLQRPEILRKFFSIANIVNFLFIVHIFVTIYNEIFWVSILTQTSTLNQDIGKYPQSFVTEHYLTVLNYKQQLNKLNNTDESLAQKELLSSIDDTSLLKQRLSETGKMQERFQSLSSELTQYKQIACLNMFLILAQPLTSASQNSQIRLFVNSIKQSLKFTVFYLGVIALINIQFLYFAIHSFGFSNEHFKDLLYTPMTVFKMYVSDFTKEVNQQTKKIDSTKAHLFILAQIFIKFLFRGVMLAIVYYEYYTHVVEQDQEHSTDVNIWHAIFFCNINSDNPHKNKRAQKQQENEIMANIEKNFNQRDKNANNQSWRINFQNKNSAMDAMNNNQLEINVLQRQKLSFTQASKPTDWAMKCGEDIKTELQARNSLQISTKQWFKKYLMFYEKLISKEYGKKSGNQDFQNFQLRYQYSIMTSRFDLVSHNCNAIQFYFMQTQLIDGICKAQEKEIKRLKQALNHQRMLTTTNRDTNISSLQQFVAQKLQAQKVKSDELQQFQTMVDILESLKNQADPHSKRVKKAH